jgi:ribosomal protein L35AE/L33A
VIATGLMILSAVCAPLQEPQGEQPQSAAAIVTKMLARYAGAKTMTGKITLTQGAMGQSGQVHTEFQFELPAKLYIRQVKSTGQGASCLITSDGKYFSYPSPKLTWQDPGTRLVEAVKVRDKQLTVNEIYAAVGLSLVDRNPALDIAIGRKEDLEFLRNQWAGIEYRGTVREGDEDLHVVIGGYREYGTAPVTGQFRMKIGPEGDLREYALSESLKLGDLGVQTVLSTWAVRIEVDGKPDQALFKLVR